MSRPMAGRCQAVLVSSPITVRWKGSEGSKQTKHTTRKLTPCWFQKCNFFENLPTPFFVNVCFIKFGPFSALLALPVMIREEYGQMAHQTLPNILLSRIGPHRAVFEACHLADNTGSTSCYRCRHYNETHRRVALHPKIIVNKDKLKNVQSPRCRAS